MRMGRLSGHVSGPLNVYERLPRDSSIMELDYEEGVDHSDLETSSVPLGFINLSVSLAVKIKWEAGILILTYH